MHKLKVEPQTIYLRGRRSLPLGPCKQTYYNLKGQYSTTKVSLRFEVFTTLIKAIYVIYGGLTHPLTSRTEQTETWINNNGWPKYGRSQQQITKESMTNYDIITILEFERPHSTTKYSLRVEVYSILIKTIYDISLAKMWDF
jgi:hypothetical protein